MIVIVSWCSYIRSRACCSHVSWVGARCRCRHGVRWGVGRHSAGICHFSICIHMRREGLEFSKVDISNIFEWMMDWCLGNCLNLLAFPALERLKLVRHRLEVEKVESLAFPAPWGTITTKKVIQFDPQINCLIKYTFSITFSSRTEWKGFSTGNKATTLGMS